MYADFDMRYSGGHPFGVFCPYGRTVHLKESEVPERVNRVTCPVCGYGMMLIRPKANSKED